MLKKDIKDIDEFYKEWTKHEAQYKHGGENGEFTTFLFKINHFKKIINYFKRNPPIIPSLAF